MKTFVAIILALGTGFAAAYVVVSKQAKHQAELPTLQPISATTSAPAEKVIVKTVTAAPAGEAPQDILNDLLSIRLGSTGGDRNTALRTVVFKLESLAQCGREAVPAIRVFIGRSVDVNYSQDNNQNDQGNNNGNGGGNNGGNGGNGGNNQANNNNNNGGGGFGFRGGARRARNLQNLQTDWVVPPSLRLGLVSTLKEVGGPDSEQALVEMLSTTGRGVEVAYLTVVLQEMAPNKYRDTAVHSAKDLLMHPLAIDNPDRLDELSKSYLYGVLEYYNDGSFAPNAQQMLVGPDGRLDMDAMDYLSTVLKDQSVSALYSAYNNASLTNGMDKRRLGRDILNFVGQNAQANQFFSETLNSTDVDNRTKMFSIVQLAGNFGGFGGGDNLTDLQIINQRLSYLQGIQGQYAGDPNLAQAFAATIKALQTGEPVDFRGLFNNNGQGGGGMAFGGGGGGGGRRGNRGGAGGGGD